MTDWPAWAKDEYEERAAIMQYHGGKPRKLAERAARRYVESLLRDGSPLAGVPDALAHREPSHT